MNVFVIIFMVIASSFVVGTLGYVIVDIVLEIRNKNKPEEENKEEPIISDSLAMKISNYESGAGHGQQGIINVGVFDYNFNAHDVITISVLKEKGLIFSKVGRMKVLAHGVLNEPLTIKSEIYSIQEAIKMIELTGGTVIILED